MSASEGRRFAFTVGSAFLVLAGLLVWRGHLVPAWVVGALGSLLMIAGAVVPTRLAPVLRAWMALAHAISGVTTPVFLTLVYFLVILPIGVVRRTFGRSPLFRPDGPSYWVRRSEGSRRSDLERQF